MCGDNTSALELEAITSAPPAARRGKAGKARARSGVVPDVAAGRRKLSSSAWTGVRFRHSGKWATEIRVPRTREKVWIGTFASPRQAALAYDAAVFCLFGERPPKSRPINFPGAPRPEISETVRVQLSIADMKVISEKHACEVDAMFPPLEDADTAAAAPEEQVVAPVTPLAVDPPCAADASAPPKSPDEWHWDNDELYQTLSSVDFEAFQF